MKTPKIKTKKRRDRTHIPALSGARLKAAFDRLEQTALPPAAKQQLRAMLGAASNPDAERPDVVLRTLEPERQADAAETMRAVAGVFRGATSRGREALIGMSDDEWAELVEGE